MHYVLSSVLNDGIKLLSMRKMGNEMAVRFQEKSLE
jgi:hypothetical protein